MPFTDSVQQVEAADANVRSMFGGQGQRITRRDDPGYEAEVARAAALYEAVVTGRRPEHHLREALTTDDFPILFGDVLSRSLLSGYGEQTYTWQNYADRRTVRDLREIRLVMVNGGASRLERVGERDEYPESGIAESDQRVRPFKYGRVFDLSLEMLVNDDLGVFSTNGTMQRFGRGARRTEEWVATNLHTDANGPHAGVYTAGNGNIVDGNPPLSRSALQAGLQALSEQVDEDGEPIIIEAVELVVPTALELTAREILDTREYRITDAAGNVQILTGNGVSANLRLNVNHYIPRVADAANGATSWFLFANPSAQRPALVMAFLRGFDTPQMFVKRPDAEPVGGGAAEMVDFETDSRRYKVRHFVGGVSVDPKATVASNGSGV